MKIAIATGGSKGLGRAFRHLRTERGDHMQAGIRDASKLGFPDVERFVQRKENGHLVAPERAARAHQPVRERQDLIGEERFATGDHLD